MNNPFHIVTLELISYTQGKARYGSKIALEKRIGMWRGKGVACHRLGLLPLANLPMSIEIVLWLLYAPLKIIRLYERRRCHVILCSSHDFFNLWPAFTVSKLLKIPYVIIVHHLTGAELKGGLTKRYRFRVLEGFKKNEAFLFGLISIVNQRILSKSRYMVAVSNSTRKQLLGLGIKGSKVIYNGIENLPLNGKDVAEIEDTKEYDGIFLGRLSPDRGIFDLIEIWTMVVRKKPKSKLLIIGEGLPYYMQKLRQLMGIYKLDGNIDLVGVVRDEDRFLLMSRSKVFILPSHNEGFCLAISEALSAGLPVVAYELPAILEVYGGCPAIFYVKKGCYEKFAEMVLQLSRRENTRKELGKKGVDFVKTLSQKFSWEHTSNELLLFLKSIRCQYVS